MNAIDTLSLYWTWGLSFIDWKVWLVILLIGAGLTFQFWAPIWLALPLWMKVGIIFIIVAVMAYFAGRNTGAKGERDVQRKKDAEGEQLRTRIDDTIKRLDATALEKRASKYYRD